MSLSFLKRKRERKYGEVKPKPPVRRGLEWLSPATRRAQRFMRTPELKPVGNRWGQRSLGTVAQVPVVPVVSGQAVTRAAPVVSGAPGGVVSPARPSTSTQQSTLYGAGHAYTAPLKPGVPPVGPGATGTVYGAGHTYTVPTKPAYPAPTPAPTPSPRVPQPGGRPMGR